MTGQVSTHVDVKLHWRPVNDDSAWVTLVVQLGGVWFSVGDTNSFLHHKAQSPAAVELTVRSFIQQRLTSPGLLVHAIVPTQDVLLAPNDALVYHAGVTLLARTGVAWHQGDRNTVTPVGI